MISSPERAKLISSLSRQALIEHIVGNCLQARPQYLWYAS